ncbi:MAG: NTP transferase domain-containing protein [Chlamydiota bacterium]|nr:NTP transferase domain-containing protein [Chlamydiota bacterium]
MAEEKGFREACHDFQKIGDPGMKALILTAGIGQRMMPHTQDHAKAMLPVGGKPILEHMLSSLSKAGISEAFLVVGHQKEQISKYFGRKWHDLNITYFENPRYHEGSILSLWTAREVLHSDDFLIMDADVVFDFKLINRLIRSRHQNCVLLDRDFTDTGEEMKLGVRSERVQKISKSLHETYDLIGEGVGFYKIAQASLDGLIQHCRSMIEEGKDELAYEDVIDVWCRNAQLGFELVNRLAWTEIDFFKDLEKARKVVFPNIILSEHKGIFCRFLSSKLTRFLIRTPLTPNQITISNVFVGLFLLLFFCLGGYGFGLVAALLFELFYVLDNCDGEVARIKGLGSRFGGWLDFSSDAFVHVLLFPSIAVGLWRQSHQSLYLWMALSTMIGIGITFAIFMIKQARREMGLGHDRSREENKWLVKVRDFSLLVVLAAVCNALHILLGAASIGIHVFWISVLIFRVREGDF